MNLNQDASPMWNVPMSDEVNSLRAENAALKAKLEVAREALESVVGCECENHSEEAKETLKKLKEGV